MANARGRFRGRINPASLFNPAQLFSGVAGFYHRFSDLTSLYADSAGATPVTLPDTAIGLVADRSWVRSPVTVAAGVQASAGLRPKWGRAPRLRWQLLLYTNDFSNAVWAKTRATVTPAATVAPDGTLTASKLVETATTGAHYIGQTGAIHNETRTFAIWLKAAERNFAVIQVGSNLAYGIAYINLLTGEVSGVTGGYTVTATLDPSGNGWYKCVISGPSNSATVAAIGAVYASTGSGILSYTGDGTSGIYVWRAQVVIGAVDLPYQDAPSAFDMTEVGFPSFGYARFGLDDDILNVTMPAAQTGDVMIFGRKGSWLQSGVSYGSGAVAAIGPTTMTGLPAGLLSVLQGAASDASGGIVGILAIGRTLTVTERQNLLDYHDEFGAAGLLTAGAELIVNGGFDVDLTGWTIQDAARGVATWDTGRAKIDNIGSGNGNLYRSISTVIGQPYLVQFDAVSRVTASGRLFVGTSAVNASNLELIATVYPSTMTGVFIASAATTYISVVAIGVVGTSAIFDNVSVKPLTVTQ